jgi:hypothetical protein
MCFRPVFNPDGESTKKRNFVTPVTALRRN